jgi:hypothetical protein
MEGGLYEKHGICVNQQRRLNLFEDSGLSYLVAISQSFQIARNNQMTYNSRFSNQVHFLYVLIFIYKKPFTHFENLRLSNTNI